MIWKKKFTEDELRDLQAGTMLDHLEIKVKDIGDDYLIAEMPINSKTIQPNRILHGGASAALSESMGSIASTMCIDLTSEIPVGIEINANHLYQGTGSKVIAETTPIRIGKKIHVWSTKIYNEENKLICISRLTVMIIKKK